MLAYHALQFHKLDQIVVFKVNMYYQNKIHFIKILVVLQIFLRKQQLNILDNYILKANSLIKILINKILCLANFKQIGDLLLHANFLLNGLEDYLLCQNLIGEFG